MRESKTQIQAPLQGQPPLQGQAQDLQSSYDASLAANGRTFHWARRFLGKAHGANAARLYAFCRLLDDLADGDLPNGKARLEVISRDLAALAQDQNAEPRDPDMAAFAPFMMAQKLPPYALRHLIEGLLSDQGTVQLASQDALIIYGYQVAGTVGLMMCPILDCHDDLSQAFAIDMGIAMQLTNIARDVLEDAKMGRRYLPAHWLDGLTPAQIADGAKAQDPAIIAAVSHAINRTITLADSYYESGFSGLAFLPKRAQIAIAIAAYSYRQIGHQLHANGTNWHHGRTVTSTATKARQSLNALRYCLPQSAPATHHSPLQSALKSHLKSHLLGYAK